MISHRTRSIPWNQNLNEGCLDFYIALLYLKVDLSVYSYYVLKSGHNKATFTFFFIYISYNRILNKIKKKQFNVQINKLWCFFSVPYLISHYENHFDSIKCNPVVLFSIWFLSRRVYLCMSSPRWVISNRLLIQHFI